MCLISPSVILPYISQSLSDSLGRQVPFFEFKGSFVDWNHFGVWTSSLPARITVVRPASGKEAESGFGLEVFTFLDFCAHQLTLQLPIL